MFKIGDKIKFKMLDKYKYGVQSSTNFPKGYTNVYTVSQTSGDWFTVEGYNWSVFNGEAVLYKKPVIYIQTKE